MEKNNFKSISYIWCFFFKHTYLLFIKFNKCIAAASFEFGGRGGRFFFQLQPWIELLHSGFYRAMKLPPSLLDRKSSNLLHRRHGVADGNFVFFMIARHLIVGTSFLLGRWLPFILAWGGEISTGLFFRTTVHLVLPALELWWPRWERSALFQNLEQKTGCLHETASHACPASSYWETSSPFWA